MERTPVSVYLDTTLRACAELMTEESIGAVLVTSSRHLVGVLSERDIVTAVAAGAGLDLPPGQDFMTADVDALDERATIGDAVSEMLGNEIRHVAVTREGRPIGLVSIRDVLAVLAGTEDRQKADVPVCSAEE